MGTIRSAVGTVFRRPFILFYFAVVMLVGAVINHFNPLFTLLFGLSTIGGGNVLDSMISFLQLAGSLIASVQGLWVTVFVLAGIGVVSVLIGLVFAGCFHIINNTVEGKEKQSGEFPAGTRKYFGRVTWISVQVLLWGVLLVMFLLVASLPGMVMTRYAMSSKPDMLILAVLFDLLTGAAVFFSLLYFRTYVLLWFPAAFHTEKAPFKQARRLVDQNFWEIARRLIFFDVIYILFQSVIVYLNHFYANHEAAGSAFSTGILIGNWVFKTLFIAVFAAYIFSAYKRYSAAKR